MLIRGNIMLSMKYPSRSEIAKALKQYMRDKGLSTTDVGKKCGFAQTTAGNISRVNGVKPYA